MFQRKRAAAAIVFGLCAVLTLALLAVRVGSVAAKPIMEHLFTNPDGTPCERPCLLGIRPNRMSFRAAYAILQRHPLVEWHDPVYCGKNSGLCTFRLSGFGGGQGVFTSFDQDAENNRIVDIYIQWHGSTDGYTNTPTFGDTINALGSPRYIIPHNGYKCCQPQDFTEYLQKMDLFSGLYGLTLYYDQLGVEVTDQARIKRGSYLLSSTSPILGLRVFTPYPICSRTQQYWSEWRGFGDVFRYFGTPTKTC